MDIKDKCYKCYNNAFEIWIYNMLIKALTANFLYAKQKNIQLLTIERH